MESKQEGPKNRKLMQPKGYKCLKEIRKGSKLDFYINICSGNLVKKAHLGFVDQKDENVLSTGEIRSQSDGCCPPKEKSGLHWQIPYILGHLRHEIHKGKQCEIIDIAYAESTIEIAKCDKQFHDLVIQTTHEAIDNLLGIKFEEKYEILKIESLGKPSLMSVNTVNNAATTDDNSS
eukprot:UN29535